MQKIKMTNTGKNYAEFLDSVIQKTKSDGLTWDHFDGVDIRVKPVNGGKAKTIHAKNFLDTYNGYACDYGKVKLIVGMDKKTDRPVFYVNKPVDVKTVKLSLKDPKASATALRLYNLIYGRFDKLRRQTNSAH